MLRVLMDWTKQMSARKISHMKSPARQPNALAHEAKLLLPVVRNVHVIFYQYYDINIFRWDDL